MPKVTCKRLGAFANVEAFSQYIQELGIEMPTDGELASGPESPLAKPAQVSGLRIGNRFAIHPMEGWDGTPDGNPTPNTLRRWRRFGQSGAKLIWGGEAVAVQPDGRANPNQLMIKQNNVGQFEAMRKVLADEHQRVTGSVDDLVVGLQLTHSGRFARPNKGGEPEPIIAYRHPILDGRLGLAEDYPLISDGEIQRIIANFHKAAKLAQKSGFDFVDVKHCHGYLGHELLSAHTRAGAYGGSFENRTRFLREIVSGIRQEAPGLVIGVRLSAFDMVPFHADPDSASVNKSGVGVADTHKDMVPYRWGFGVNRDNPIEPDLDEPIQFLKLLGDLGIQLVNISAGSPYYNPHIQRPALYPPCDGYQPPNDPLIDVARQLHVVKQLKEAVPELFYVGTGYTYLQDYLPHVAQAVVRAGWVDSVGLGRMVLSYPQLPWDVVQGNALQTKLICRTLSDCTTAPRKGLPSGCYPLDDYYKKSDEAVQLRIVKRIVKREAASASK